MGSADYPDKTKSVLAARHCDGKSKKGSKKSPQTNRLPQNGLTRLFVCLDCIASSVENADHGMIRPAVELLMSLHLPRLPALCHNRSNGSASDIRSTPSLSLRGRTS
jgi:hypothetical protein